MINKPELPAGGITNEYEAHTEVVSGEMQLERGTAGKHTRKMLGSHTRYARFLTYCDAAGYHAKLEEFRHALESEIGK